MTDTIRALCAELADAYLRTLEHINNSTWLGYEPSDDPLLQRARASLADEPPEPEGREPASVTEQPSDEELLELWQGWNLGWDPQKGMVLMPHPAEYARAVLARWGTSNLAETRSSLGGMPTPVPADKGEVEELVVELRMMASQAAEACQFTDAENLSRAADLLQRLSPPQLVPVSERLPGPEDCDAEGRCWLFSKVEKEWRLIDAGNPGVPHLKYCFSHWLPAHALPVPHQQENAND